MKINNKNTTQQPKWEGLAPYIAKIQSSTKIHQKTKSTRLTIDITIQSPWFPRKVQPEPSSRFMEISLAMHLLASYHHKHIILMHN